jgi:predicted nucleotidyltransferase
MVKLHAELAELPAPRTTVDVDSTLHLETQAITFAQAAERLQEVGYVLDPETKYAYRFDRGSERVDLLCSDRQSIWRAPRYDGRPLFGIPGGTRALQQTINLDVLTETDTVRLVVPTIRGALVLKGAAYLEDSRDRGRHAEDAVLLLACMDAADEVLHGLSRRSRRRVRALVKVLTEQTAPWISHDEVVQSLAREGLTELDDLLGR